MARSKEYKDKQIERLCALLAEYHKIIFVSLDQVGAAHLQKIRQKLRAHGALIFVTKKTRARVAVQRMAAQSEHLDRVLPLLKGNIGFVFTNGDLSAVYKVINDFKVPSAAKVGMISPVSVVVPAGNTSLPPSQTSFMQALRIATKINKGAIQILNDVEILRPGQKVSKSEAVLLEKLNITPFTIQMEMLTVYDQGEVYPASALAIPESEIFEMFSTCVANVACLSVAAGIPNAASIGHLVQNAARNLFAIAASTEYVFEQAKDLKERLKNPSAFVQAVAAPVAAKAAEVAVVEEQPEEKSEEEEEDFGGFDIFG